MELMVIKKSDEFWDKVMLSGDEEGMGYYGDAGIQDDAEGDGDGDGAYGTCNPFWDKGSGGGCGENLFIICGDYSNYDEFGYGEGDIYGGTKRIMPSSKVRLWWVKIERSTELLKRHYLKEPNAEIRSRIIEKIGLEPIIVDLKPKLLDRRESSVGGIYELYEIILHHETRLFLKMINPSTGIFHAEWVHPNVETVEEALLWRNGGVLPDNIS